MLLLFCCLEKSFISVCVLLPYSSPYPLNPTTITTATAGSLVQIVVVAAAGVVQERALDAVQMILQLFNHDPFASVDLADIPLGHQLLLLLLVPFESPVLFLLLLLLLLRLLYYDHDLCALVQLLCQVLGRVDGEELLVQGREYVVRMLLLELAQRLHVHQ